MSHMPLARGVVAGPRKRLSALALGVALTLGTSVAFLVPVPDVVGRRELVLGVTSGAVLASPGLAHAEKEPLVPPVVKDLVRVAPQIQEGLDYFYFDLQDAIKKQDLKETRKCLGAASEGSYVSPIEKNVLYPLQQLSTSNPDAEEDGWLGAIRTFNRGMEEMSEGLDSLEWKKVEKAWSKAKDSVTVMLNDINERADKPPFVVLSDEYENRRAQYIQEKKDAIKFRNMRANMVMR
mmetsp:Transcript_34787/g.63334  ORF Transcript_34787/g.63334 Transcript_34787/m.63334 type:complete len:236 (+) Transcript_34787:39-746(+)